MGQYWFTSAHERRQSKLALITCVLAFIVILLGAYTRLTNAGLSCPDWPHCYGYLTAPHTNAQLQGATERYPGTPVDVKKAWTEMTHRYFAGTEGLLILVLAFGMLKNHRRDGLSWIVPVALITLLGTQVTLGMLTVTEKLKPVIVLGHLLNGLSLLCLLWFAFLSLRPTTQVIAKPNRRLTKWLWIGFVIVALQITLGGWVSSHYAGLACIDFPYCNGVILPALKWGSLNTDLITIHMLHRIGAVITALYLAGLSIALFCDKPVKSYGVILFILLCLQVLLGIFNIIWLRPVWLAMIHHTVGILLLLTMIALLVKATRTRVT